MYEEKRRRKKQIFSYGVVLVLILLILGIGRFVRKDMPDRMISGENQPGQEEDIRAGGRQSPDLVPEETPPAPEDGAKADEEGFRGFLYTFLP